MRSYQARALIGVRPIRAHRASLAPSGQVPWAGKRCMHAHSVKLKQVTAVMGYARIGGDQRAVWQRAVWQRAENNVV